MRKKKERKMMMKSDFFGSMFLSSCIPKGMFVNDYWSKGNDFAQNTHWENIRREYFCQLLGNIILSACLVWGL